MVASFVEILKYDFLQNNNGSLWFCRTHRTYKHV